MTSIFLRMSRNEFEFSDVRYDLEDRIRREIASRCVNEVNEVSDDVQCVEACIIGAQYAVHNAVWFNNKPYAPDCDTPVARLAHVVDTEVPLQIHIFNNGKLWRSQIPKYP